MLNFYWDMAVAHSLIRRKPRHSEAQMAWKLLVRHWAELLGLEYSVYYPPAIFQNSSYKHVRITRRTVGSSFY